MPAGLTPGAVTRGGVTVLLAPHGTLGGINGKGAGGGRSWGVQGGPTGVCPDFASLEVLRARLGGALSSGLVEDVLAHDRGHLSGALRSLPA